MKPPDIRELVPDEAHPADYSDQCTWPALSASVPCPNPAIADVGADMPNMTRMTQLRH